MRDVQCYDATATFGGQEKILFIRKWMATIGVMEYGVSVH